MVSMFHHQTWVKLPIFRRQIQGVIPFADRCMPQFRPSAARAGLHHECHHSALFQRHLFGGISWQHPEHATSPAKSRQRVVKHLHCLVSARHVKNGMSWSKAESIVEFWTSSYSGMDFFRRYGSKTMSPYCVLLALLRPHALWLALVTVTTVGGRGLHIGSSSVSCVL